MRQRRQWVEADSVSITVADFAEFVEPDPSYHGLAYWHVFGNLPGMGNIKQAMPDGVDERKLLQVEAIIASMTPAERRRHDLINGSRRKRIARGSGTSVEDVNRLLKQFVQMRKMLKVMGGAMGGGGGKGGKLYKKMSRLRSLMG